jgi:hypothetical protein
MDIDVKAGQPGTNCRFTGVASARNNGGLDPLLEQVREGENARREFFEKVLAELRL